DFATNQQLFLFYPYDSTGNDGSGPVTNRLVRITASGDVMLPGSETVVLGSTIGSGCPGAPSANCMPQDWYGHSADSIRFAADGTMFVSMGDAASWSYVDDLALRAQNIDQYPGKILHIAKDGSGLPSNPFWNGNPSAIRSKVWAYGFRNPFRMTLHPTTGLPYVGDVGWDAVEELDLATAGGNFGWPCYEGAAQQPGYASKSVCQALYAQGPSAVKAPLHAWAHDAGLGGTAVAGPFTPSTSAFPAAYQGGLFFADYAQGWIRFLKIDGAGQPVGSPLDFATQADGPVDLSFGADGNLYYVAINAGQVRRVRPGSSSGTTTFLSDLTPTGTPTNAWGPYERDRSNGEQGATDGAPLRIGGTTYPKGLGVHAASDIR
ncbi:MAG: PQQ-dependent sugar dehydrogenase, partial [Acidimicrobiales bacterium]|nr:PQQ-dependent sugar dehydrogenase [Acidimicrobiales bacterium]